MAEELDNEVVDISRVSKVVKGGRNLGFRVVMAVGDGEGKVGIGKGNTRNIPRAIQQGIRDAKKSMIVVPVRDGTITHQVLGKFKAGRVLLKPAYPGTGVIAGETVGIICRLAGIRNILTKSFGSNNPLTLAKATIDGLSNLRTFKEVTALRGVKLEEIGETDEA